MPSVLVTGASRGIGRATTLRLAARGWDVVAGVRRPEDGEALSAAHPERITIVELAVTDERQIAALDGALPAEVDAAHNRGAGIRQDLAAFDKRFDLPAPDLVLSRAPGYAGETYDPGIEGELDAETVHAIAPGAKIDIMFFGTPPPFTPADLGAVIRAAAARGDIVSASFGRCEQCESSSQLRSLTSALRYARSRHVTVIAASGDDGAATTTNFGVPLPRREVNLPCANPLVTCVGGTTLSADYATGMYRSESAWNTGHRLPLGGATSGGISALYARLDYQAGMPVIGSHRGVPDVAACAAGDKSLDVVAVLNGRPVDQPAGGTSAAAPLWAGIAALADQDAHRHLGFLNPGLYSIGRSSQYHRAFHDVTHGNNTVIMPSGKRIRGYQARSGWDPVTGWGSPNAQVLVPLLVRAVNATVGPFS